MLKEIVITKKKISNLKTTKKSNTVIFKNGTKRIKISDLKEYIHQDGRWVPTGKINEHAKKIIENYSKHNTLDILIDEDDNEFLKGYVNPDEMISGKRIKVLPNGKKLARGGFSVFAKNLEFNNNKKFEWDVCYENYSGLKTYLYSEDKIEHEKKRKTKIVNEFIRAYPIILEKLQKDLKSKKTNKYLGLYTLLMTHIRVGNLEYYHKLKHKGLTTLQKRDIKIEKEVNKKNTNFVEFNFIGKDGVPQNIKKEFPDFYVKILDSVLKSKKADDFVFTDKDNHPLHSLVFSKIMFKYTNKHFYPHIIRSYYADTQCRNFIKNNNKLKPIDKKKVTNKFKEIALDLGHKKFNKKKNIWEADYKVTVNNYIRPEYYTKMLELCQSQK